MNRQSFKNWDNIEGETESKSGASPAMLRLPYALAKEKGLNTDGMTPRQVWDMLKGKGVDKAAEEKKFIASQKGGKQPQEEQSSESAKIEALKQEYKKEVLTAYEQSLPYRRILSAKQREKRLEDIKKYEQQTDEMLARQTDFSDIEKFIEKIKGENEEKQKKRKSPIKLPTLNGSEKQVLWADDIRFKMAEALEGLTELLNDNPRAMELAEQSIKNKTVHRAFNRSRIVQMHDLKMAIAILKETDARWFIDNR